MTIFRPQEIDWHLIWFWSPFLFFLALDWTSSFGQRLMKSKKSLLRKRRSDGCCPQSDVAVSCRCTKSLNDIPTSAPEGLDKVKNSLPTARRKSFHLFDQELDKAPKHLDFIQAVGQCRKRSVDFGDELIESNDDAKTLNADRRSARFVGAKTSVSCANVTSSRRRYPFLRSQMSDPSNSGTTLRRSSKRNSSGKSLMDFTGNESQSVSYSAVAFKGNFDPLSCSCPSLNVYSPGGSFVGPGNSLEDSWKSIYAVMVTSQGAGVSPGAIRNPNKAILTLEHPSTRILIANETAHRLFAVGHDRLVGRRLTDMLSKSSSLFNGTGGPLAESGDAIDGVSTMDGPSLAGNHQKELIAACGKVIEIIDALGAASPVAIWLYPLPPNQSKNGPSNRCLAVLEPVERVTASCTLGPKGRIFACDDYVADVFGYRSSTEILGFGIAELVPALVLPTSKQNTEQFRQNLTGRFRNGASFPVTVKLVPEFDGNQVMKYDATFYIYTTISGLITVLPNGMVHSFNDHFVSTMFGLRPESLDGKNITTIIPKFYNEVSTTDTDGAGNFSFDESGSLACLRFSELSLNESARSWRSRLECGSTNSLLMLGSNFPSGSSSATVTINEAVPNAIQSDSTALAHATPPLLALLTAPIKADTNDNPAGDAVHFIPEGHFWGFGLHRDGSLFGIGYQIRKLVLKDGGFLYCIWVVRDPEALICHNLSRFGAGCHSLNRSDSSIDTSPELATITKKLPGTRSIVDLESEEKDYIRGEYAQCYDTLQQLGKGAYGCVKMASRKSDGLLVVTKFILKDRIFTDCWTQHSILGRIPLEIDLLLKLRHDNIVKVLAVYQNESYFQMVMEKHGSGMDLFEFIDRHPAMDEKLASYIFRQVVAAVSYLHSLNIVHRDIKDENVIINEQFHCKLIDFGAAAYFKEGKTFSTICGTIEYCSPEVLAGERYKGPELEMWSMGVILYTLVFFENPFDSVEETIQANLDPPWDISEGLFHLLSWLLHPFPQDRATISDVERHWWVNQSIDMKRYKFEDIVIVKDYRELNPPRYLADLTSVTSVQASPPRLQSKPEPLP